MKIRDEYKGEEDYFASSAYNRALLLFRKEGDSDEAREALKKAVAINAHLSDYLLGYKNPPERIPNHYKPGHESEAVIYLLAGWEAWQKSKGALDWLGEVVKY